MLAQSSALDRSALPSNNTPAAKRLENDLPPVLSAKAGMVEIISFVSLKLFTAHVTGNLVVIAALLVRGGPRSGSVPVIEDARTQLKRTVQLVVGFFAGCLLGAGAFSWLGEWALLLPVLLAGVAVALP